MRSNLFLIAALLLLGPACEAGAQTQSALDSASYYRLLPSLADLPQGSVQVVQTQRGGSTFVRVFQVTELGLNSALRLFERPDSAAAYLKRFTIAPKEFAAAAEEGMRSRGMVPDSVQADSLTLSGITAPHRRGTIARYYLPSGVFIMTQAVVATPRYMVLLQIGGANRETEIVSLTRTLASLVDQRLSSAPDRTEQPGR